MRKEVEIHMASGQSFEVEGDQAEKFLNVLHADSVAPIPITIRKYRVTIFRNHIEAVSETDSDDMQF